MPWIRGNNLKHTPILKLFSKAKQFFPRLKFLGIQNKPYFVVKGRFWFGERISHSTETHKLKTSRTAIAMGALTVGTYACLSQHTPVLTAAFEDEEENSQKEETLLKLIIESLDNIEFVRGKEIILLMGATGAGKSTLVNYLLGRKMKIVNGMMEVEGQTLAEIGKNPMRSQTVHPGVYERDGRIYIDCPGLFDTRMLEGMWAKLSTQLLIKNSAQIKGIILVVDHASMLAMRGKPLLDLCESLTIFFKDTQKLSNSISLVITRTEGYKSQPSATEITEYIQKAIEEREREIKQIDSEYGIGDAQVLLKVHKRTTFEQSGTKAKYEGFHRVVRALRLISSAKIIVANLVDKQRGTAKAIHDQINTLMPISPTEVVSERLASTERRDFDNLIHGTASRNYRLLCKQQELFSKIKQAKYELKKPYANENEKAIEEYTKRGNAILLEIEKIALERSDLETQGDEDVCVYKDSCVENRDPLGFLGWSFKKFEYEGQPFTKIRVTKNDGSEFIPGTWFSGDGYFEEEIIQNSMYSSTYKSAYYHNGDVSIEIYGKQKYLKEHIQKRNNLEASLKKATEELQKNKEEYAQLVKAASGEEREKLNKQRLEQIKSDILRLERSLISITNSLEHRWNSFFAIQNVVKLWGDYTNEKTDFMIQSFCKELNNPGIYMSHAEQLCAMGRYDAAIERYKQAIRYDPWARDNVYFVYEWVGDSLKTLERFEEADNYYKMALAGDIPLFKKFEIEKKRSEIMPCIHLAAPAIPNKKDANVKTSIWCSPKVIGSSTVVGLFWSGISYYYGASLPNAMAIGSVAGTMVGGGIAYKESIQPVQAKKFRS